MPYIPYGELPKPTNWDCLICSVFRLTLAEADRLLATRAISQKCAMGYSLRGASLELGIHPSTGRRWVAKAEWMDDYLHEMDLSTEEPAAELANDIPF